MKERLIRIQARIALEKKLHFIDLVEETGKHIEDSMAIAQEWKAENQELPIAMFIFSENIGIGAYKHVYDCDADFQRVW